MLPGLFYTVETKFVDLFSGDVLSESNVLGKTSVSDYLNRFWGVFLNLFLVPLKTRQLCGIVAWPRMGCVKHLVLSLLCICDSVFSSFANNRYRREKQYVHCKYP